MNPIQPDNPAQPGDDARVRPFAELRSSGLLWLINATVFHPRGYAIGLALDDDGQPFGWELFGDGTERWAYAEEAQMPDGRTMHETLDELFQATKTLMP